MSANEQRRPDPDSLLALTRGPAGRLKVFVGAAPGVGKTYAMLSEARRLQRQGVDVVIGLVETHGRAETQALVEGLEILPRAASTYRGQEIAEFDLDAALARRPQLILVDELAHSNAPESRHPKRWQDVEELLAAGIDVWTALNIQHLESLADTVARITGVAVRETVPDRILAAADVALIDIPPQELIARLNEGKVYAPATAGKAAQNFFTPANLTALREIALRRTADRVDDDVAAHLKAGAVEGPYGASERLMACIGPDELSEQVVRRTAQLALGLNAGFLAVTVAPPGFDADPARAAKLAGLMGLVERLGGEAIQAQAHDVPAEILRLARRENVTQIVLGEGRRRWRRSLGRTLLARGGGIELHIVPGAPTPTAPRRLAPFARLGLAQDAGLAAAAVAAAVGLGEALTAWLPLPNLSIVFLASVLVCAIRRGARSAVLASVLSFLAYNFFFIAPLYTFTVAQPYELFALVVFLAVSVLAGSLAGRLRDQRERIARNAAATQSLYEFSRKLSAASGAEAVLWTAAAQVHATFGGEVVVLTPQGEALSPRAAWPPDATLGAADEAAARWALQKSEPAGALTGTLPKLKLQFRPLAAASGVLAVCGFEPKRPAEPLTPEEERALTAILDQTAIALDRAWLAGEAVKAATLAENEKVRDALIDSLSHDLRTPLATIAGSASALAELGDRITAEEGRGLIRAIEEETARLSRFVANLIDISRIEAGALRVARDFVDIADVVAGAAARARKTFPGFKLRVSLAPDLPLARGDARLIEQTLFNLIDNAQKYAGEAGAVVHARREGDRIVLSVTDEGPGIKPADLGRVFEKFYRGGKPDGRKPGTGLGLSICRGLVEAMGGTIEAQSPAVRRRGTRMIVRLPAAKPMEPSL